MDGGIDLDSNESEFVEVDPTGRYGRYSEILGKGASKIVYRAFDEYEGIEVAWNQVKLYDFLQSPQDLERLYCEIHLLKTLKHDNIMKFYTSWVDIANRNINFVTEMFTSGTLRQYRMKHKRVNIRAMKHWCRQILQGLLYLHSHDPPIIHRDLKCDNIFINGNQGEVKIGDLGLAAISRKSHAARCVGTPEFMAPEVYEEEYNELVDIYSFGMCILEMATCEYPYSECRHPAEIYKKVISGKKPDSLYEVKDPEVKRFIEKCLATVSERNSAWELLNDPFLRKDDCSSDLRSLSYRGGYIETNPMLGQFGLGGHHNNARFLGNDYSNYLNYEPERDSESHLTDCEANGFDLLTTQEDGRLKIMIHGSRGEDDAISLRLRVADKEGHLRNIYFPFDIELDTPLTVATEMVTELDIMDQDVTTIAEMIDGEIASLVPDWKREDCTSFSSCQNCTSDVSLLGCLSCHKPDKNRQNLQFSEHECSTFHSRFEEITFQSQASEQAGSIQPDDSHCTGTRDQDSIPDSSNLDFELSENDKYEKTAAAKKERKPSNPLDFREDNSNKIRQGLRWLKAKYRTRTRSRGPKEEQSGIVSKTYLSKSNRNPYLKDNPSSVATEERSESEHKSAASGKQSSMVYPLHSKKDEINHKFRRLDPMYNYCSPVHMVTAKSFYANSLFPHSLHRAASLPINASDILTFL